MSQTQIGILIAIAFPVFFVAMWLGVTSLLMALSGWRRLQERFPDQEHEIAVESMGWQSAIFGGGAAGGVNFNNCLKLEVCPSGLRVKVAKLFGPFTEPFFVPWRYIDTSYARVWGFRFVRLGMGSPEEGAMKLREKTARRITEGSNGQFSLPVD